MREVRIGIKRFKKLIDIISGVESALRIFISEIPGLESFMLIIGATPIRPQQVHQLSFSHGNSLLSGQCDFAQTKAAEALSRNIFLFSLLFQKVFFTLTLSWGN